MPFDIPSMLSVDHYRKRFVVAHFMIKTVELGATKGTIFLVTNDPCTYLVYIWHVFSGEQEVNVLQESVFHMLSGPLFTRRIKIILP